MTITQLRTFLVVARLGSVKAAARELRVTEPAVSGAVAALRKELGDRLFVRAGHGIALTPGGRRLAAGAAEIVGLAEETRQRVREAGSGISYLQVAATETSTEQILPALLEAFDRKQPGIDATTLAVPSKLFSELLLDRRADVTVGPAAACRGLSDTIESLPFLRFRLVVVASPDHPLATTRTPITARCLAREQWLLGPGGLDPGTLAAAFLARQGIVAEKASIFPSATAALHAAAAGDGLSIAFLHVIRGELRHRTLKTLDIAGTPVNGMLYASALRGERRSPAASALCRFVTTPAATQALLARASGVPVDHFRPTVHITIWS